MAGRGERERGRHEQPVVPAPAVRRSASVSDRHPGLPGIRGAGAAESQAGGTRVRGRLEEVGVDVCRVASATTNDVVYVWLFSTTAVSSSSIT